MVYIGRECICSGKRAHLLCELHIDTTVTTHPSPEQSTQSVSISFIEHIALMAQPRGLSLILDYGDNGGPCGYCKGAYGNQTSSHGRLSAPQIASLLILHACKLIAAALPLLPCCRHAGIPHDGVRLSRCRCMWLTQGYRCNQACSKAGASPLIEAP